MALDVLIGGTNLDANSNVKVNLPATLAQSGYARVMFENDAGTVTGTPNLASPSISQDDRLSAGLDTPLWDTSFTATSQNTNLWKYTFSTATCTQSSGFLNINAIQSTLSGASCSMSSFRNFSLMGNGDLVWEATGAFSAVPVANQVFEAGIFIPNGSAIPLDGVYFRLTSAGLIGAVNYAGTETPTGVLVPSSAFPSMVGGNGQYKIRVSTRLTTFWLNGVQYGSIPTPAGNGSPFSYMSLPVTFNYRNTNTVGASGMVVKLSMTRVEQVDLNLGKPLPDIMASMGMHGGIGQDGQTMGSTALYTNSLAAGAGAVMTNTTAALGVGLGGQFSALPTLAAGTDGILCSYANPAGSATSTPVTLYVKGIKLQGCVTTVLVGNATPVVYAFAACWGHTAVSLATAEGTSFTTTPTTKAPRRIPFGFESYGAAAAVGTVGSASGVAITFATPLVINPGEFFAISAKNLGVVTTTGVITFTVGIDSYAE